MALQGHIQVLRFIVGPYTIFSFITLMSMSWMYSVSHIKALNRLRLNYKVLVDGREGTGLQSSMAATKSSATADQC